MLRSRIVMRWGVGRWESMVPCIRPVLDPPIFFGEKLVSGVGLGG